MAGRDISDALRRLLKERGWTQDQLALKSGIARTDINRMATGKLRAGDARLKRIAGALDVSVLELAPEEEADEKGLTLLERLDAQEALLEEALGALSKVTRKVTRLQARVARLEAQQGQQPGAEAGS
jgi:transcriptional regulator with XRE-family HTH domain